MKKSKEMTEPTSCWNRADIDEPVFVLRAHDENAPRVVETWVDRYVSSKGGYNELTEAQRNKAEEALRLATEMRIWRASHPGIS